MPNFPKDKAVYRIIDANINRAKEGLRVCEEITRFVINDKQLSEKFKLIRHKIDTLVKALPYAQGLLDERCVLEDVGRKISGNEFKRSGIKDIFFANIQRVKESVRVLEEFTKLIDIKLAGSFKKLRYAAYEIEKQVSKRIPR